MITIRKRATAMLILLLIMGVDGYGRHLLCNNATVVVPVKNL